MTITPNQDFKHGAITFEKGQQYEVSNEDAEYFLDAGWIGELREPTTQTLEIQDMHLGHFAEVN